MYGRILPKFVVSVFALCFLHSAVHGQRIYWTDRTASEIRSDSLVNDSPSDLLLSDLDTPLGIALDFNDNKLYWTERGASGVADGTLGWSDLDGMNDATYRDGLVDPWRIAVDTTAGKLYWTDVDGIHRTDLNDPSGTNELHLPFAPRPVGLALDLVNGKIYFTTLIGTIHTADLDGENAMLVADLSIDSAPIGIALDVADFMMYWIEAFPFPKVGRGDLDGKNLDFNLAPSAFDAGGIALDLGAGKMYWTYNASIHRANLDGTGEEVLDTPSAVQPYALALDLRPDPEAPQLNIRPGSCANSVNVRSHGVVPMAILGGPDFDAASIDDSSLTLTRWDGIGASVSPKTKRSNKATLTDVAGLSRAALCDCAEVAPDGIDDLVVKFDAREMVEELELEVEPKKASLILTLRGQLDDGTLFEVSDCIVVNGTTDGPAAARRGRRNGG